MRSLALLALLVPVTALADNTDVPVPIINGEDATAALRSVAEHDGTGDQTRTHAWWVLGQANRERGDTTAARDALRRARELVDDESEPQVAERITAALAELDAT